MSDIFKEVRSAVSAADAYERYVGPVQRNKALCIWHEDHHPSLSFKADYCHCFSCGAGGSAIDLAMQLFNLDAKGAAAKLKDRWNTSDIVSVTSKEAIRASNTVMITMPLPLCFRAFHLKNFPVPKAINANAISVRKDIPSAISDETIPDTCGPITIPERIYPVTLGSLNSLVMREKQKAKSSMAANRSRTNACG